MIPDNRLSTQYIPALIMGGRGLASGPRIDHEDGGKDLSDPSEGLMSKVWTFEIVNDKQIQASAEDIAPTIIYNATYTVTSISGTFDQNMHPCVAFTEANIAKLYWYDSSIPGMTVTNFGVRHISPKVFLDDKRQMESSNSDILYMYVNPRISIADTDKLCMRMQRDRFTIEYILNGDVNGEITKFGMGRNNRLQIEIQNFRG